MLNKILRAVLLGNIIMPYDLVTAKPVLLGKLRRKLYKRIIGRLGKSARIIRMAVFN